MKWTLMCSECEKYIELAQADRIPKKCPNCGSEFDFSNPEHLMHTGGEETFIPPIEKYLKKVSDKL